MIVESSITRRIKQISLNDAKIDKVGIANIDRFAGAPEGFHPNDFLPGCRSVIACAIRIPDGAIQAVFRQIEEKKYHLHGIYGAFGYVGGPNYMLLFAAYKIAQAVERLTGKTAVAMPAGPSHGAKMMSMRHCAVAAGLGEFGWNSLVLTPEFGARNRFCAVLTTAELEPDPLYNGPRLCDPEKCKVCVKMCPVGAIPEYKKKEARNCDIGGKINAYSCLDWNKCKVYNSGFYGEFNETGKDLVDTSDKHPLNSSVEQGYHYQFTHLNNQFFFHMNSWKCGYCLEYCPVGGWKERFYDTGLSKVDVFRFVEA